jgi:excisionase family DNA binding protein
MGRAKPFSPQTLAERWGCSPQKIRLMCRSGELASFTLGKLIRIPASEVERIECQSGGSSSIESNGASPIRFLGLDGAELRLERMIGAGPKLSLVRSGGDSQSHSRNG